MTGSESGVLTSRPEHHWYPKDSPKSTKRHTHLLALQPCCYKMTIIEPLPLTLHGNRTHSVGQRSERCVASSIPQNGRTTLGGESERQRPPEVPLSKTLNPQPLQCSCSVASRSDCGSRVMNLICLKLEDSVLLEMLWRGVDSYLWSSLKCFYEFVDAFACSSFGPIS